GINRHRFWHTRCAAPVFHYVNHKYVKIITGLPRAHILKSIPLDTTRLVMAACHMMDAVFTSAVWPRPEADEEIGIYDELRMGTANKTNWLGKPLAPPVQLALRDKDLFDGEGANVADVFLKRMNSANAKIERLERTIPTIKVHSAAGDLDNLWFTLADLRLPAADAVLRLRARAEPLRDCPSSVARRLIVSCRPSSWLMDKYPTFTGIQLNKSRNRNLQTENTGAQIRYWPKKVIDGRAHQAYFVHPPYKDNNVSGYTYWERDVVLPETAELVFYTGILPARGRTDGVTFRVDIREGVRLATIFNQHQKQLKWIQRTVDLSEWSGRTVRLRFLTGAGPAGNAVSDHACWGDIHVLSAGQPCLGKPSSLPLATWVDGKWFEATFYFRNVGPGTFNFDFDVEGTTPLYLSNITLHAHPDAMIREFENGLVLANPSLKPFTFDLAELVPHRRFRRLTGSSNQDPKTNNGSQVNNTITVGPRDGLFLVKLD
ncbi:MAG: hypothetical protein JSV03_17190, partial [Planctomycetota bacterium]